MWTPLGSDAPDAYAPDPQEALACYRVNEPLAVRDHLQALRDRCAPLRLHPPASAGNLSARLVAVNAPVDRVELSVEAQGDSSAALRSCRQIIAVGLLDRVKIQFVLTQLEHLGSDGGATLRALLPTFLFRRQRRDTYRVRPSAPSTARCTVPFQDAHAPHSFEVLDASIGGVSLGWNAQPAPACGDRLDDCMLLLPGLAPFRCDLLVRSVEPMLPVEAGGWRIGCAFSKLSGPLERVMQRFVFDTDRRSLQQRAVAVQPERSS